MLYNVLKDNPHIKAVPFIAADNIEDVTDFYSRVLSHIDECIRTHWNSEEDIEKK